MTSPSSVRRPVSGFSLIELLVALAIAALVIATAVSAVSGSMAAGWRAQGQIEAAIIARTRLALAEIEPVPGESSGEQHLAGRRYGWRLAVVPHPMSADAARDAAAPALLAATVEVQWGEGVARRTLRASTLLIASSPASR